MSGNAGNGREISVLLVEDESPALDALADIIAMKYPGALLYTATNGSEGLDRFAEHLPRIVITDISMPDISGLQMAKQIKAKNPETKFIVITGKSDSSSIEMAFCAGLIDHYLIKPVILDKLFTAIDNSLGEIARQE